MGSNPTGRSEQEGQRPIDTRSDYKWYHVAEEPVAYRIRDKDIRLARSTRHFPDFLTHAMRPSELLGAAIMDVESMGYTIVKKSSSFLRLSKFSTTYYNQIRVGSGWDEYSTGQKGSVMTHEGGHGRQWRYYTPIVFAFRYMTYPRFRWAIEMQGYSMSVWAYHAMGYSEKSILGYIERRAKTIRSEYKMWSINAADVERHTRELLTSAYNDARHAIK